MFDEDKFKADPNDGVYPVLVHEGYKDALKHTLSIGMLMRDVGKKFENTQLIVKAIRNRFYKTNIYIFENDSTDDTKKLIAEWAKTDPAIEYELNDFKHPKWPMVRNARRGSTMGFYRHCVQKMMASDPTDFVMIMDADLRGISLDGIMHSIALQNKWDVCASNGLVRRNYKWKQYDAWAWRNLGDFTPLPNEAVRDIVPQRGASFIPVASAFGGMALYQWDTFQKGSYEGNDCEHVNFHKSVYASSIIRVNPSQIVLYN